MANETAGPDPPGRDGGGPSSRTWPGTPGRAAGSGGTTGRLPTHPTHAAVGCYTLLAEPAPDRAKAAFVRAGHPFRLKKLERELRVFELKQIPALR